MRRHIILITIILSGLLQGCAGNSTDKAVETADSFVKAYFSADYESAASLCGEDLKARVMESAAQIEALPDTLRSAFMELAAEMEPHAGEVYALGEDSVIVDFDILIPDEIEPMRNSVVLVRDRERKAWTVVELR